MERNKDASRFCSPKTMIILGVLFLVVFAFVFLSQGLFSDNVCKVKCNSRNCPIVAGAAECICPDGLARNSRVARCDDIDECRLNRHACNAESVCVNTVGSFKCQCRAGYEYNQYEQCVDVDECAVKSPCGPKGKCFNSPGSYHCECPAGYEHKTPQAACTEIPPPPPPMKGAGESFVYAIGMDLSPNDFRVRIEVGSLAKAAETALAQGYKAFTFNEYDGCVYLKETGNIGLGNFIVHDEAPGLITGIFASESTQLVPEAFRAKFKKI
eukprot:TRINITY_DN26700_c0_g1_i1.p1 TRINITY_DN26700_c0_g1~~TRINITY_DN26700_c0_g1_i1.p1  ORF type:complete len:269 (+),score=39.22 TRINITY_DN26700_c0_g1_i1:97-903(+)